MILKLKQIVKKNMYEKQYRSTYYVLEPYNNLRIW